MTCAAPAALNPVTTSENAKATRACNLVLVGNRGVNHLGDFERIPRYLAADAPDVRTHVCTDEIYRAWRWVAAARPTMVFSPVPLAHFRPVRGRVVTGQNLSKSEEYAALEAVGVPVPRY